MAVAALVLDEPLMAPLHRDLLEVLGGIGLTGGLVEVVHGHDDGDDGDCHEGVEQHLVETLHLEVVVGEVRRQIQWRRLGAMPHPGVAHQEEHPTDHRHGDDQQRRCAESHQIRAPMARCTMAPAGTPRTCGRPVTSGSPGRCR